MSSYQIPDLLADGIGRIPLRTNRHCLAVSRASETWILEQQALDSDRLSAAKIPLLAALCFPTCDLPQLRLVADFWTLLMFSKPFECLEPRLSQLTLTGTSRWKARFDDCFRDFQLAQGLRPNLDLGVEEYIAFRRDLSGLQIVTSFIEPVEGLELKEGTEEEETMLKKLRQSAADIIALSWDIFSYNVDQASGNKINLVHVLMARRGISVQGAITAAVRLVKSAFTEFSEAEKALVSLPRADADSDLGSSSSLLRWFRPSPARSAWTEQDFHDVSLLIQGLKDCIVGSLNWAYETELFFGTKGEEVRMFGWVFMLDKT
ncbi:isoprenoid synthase domain-containing protein [Mycena floridula]|nr:isoprenoid synthase domain-containing protein [Mycena floridula]